MRVLLDASTVKTAVRLTSSVIGMTKMGGASRARIFCGTPDAYALIDKLTIEQTFDRLLRDLGALRWALKGTVDFIRSQLGAYRLRPLRMSFLNPFHHFAKSKSDMVASALFADFATHRTLRLQ